MNTKTQTASLKIEWRSAVSGQLNWDIVNVAYTRTRGLEDKEGARRIIATLYGIQADQVLMHKITEL